MSSGLSPNWILFSLFRTEKTEALEIKWLVQGHSAIKLLGQDVDSGPFVVVLF